MGHAPSSSAQVSARPRVPGWVPFVVLLALLVLVPTLLWGFAGPWVLLALVPAAVGALTINHVRIPREERAVSPGGVAGPAVRPGVVVLGGLFTLVTGFAAVLFMWAEPAPPRIAISAERVIAASADRVWARVADVSDRKSWCPWIADADPVGRGGPPQVGSTYRGTLALERFTVPGDLTITAFEPDARFAWNVSPSGGSELSNIHETITLIKESDVLTRVRYEIAYEVPTVFGRIGERIAVRGSVERLAETSLDNLNQRVTAPR